MMQFILLPSRRQLSFRLSHSACEAAVRIGTTPVMRARRADTPWPTRVLAAAQEAMDLPVLAVLTKTTRTGRIRR